MAISLTCSNKIYHYQHAAPCLSGEHFNRRADGAAELSVTRVHSWALPTAKVYIQNGSVTSSVVFPLIAGGSSYYIDYTSNGLNVRGGGTLTDRKSVV